MERTDDSVASFPDHVQAEMAVKSLAQAGVDMKQLSIVGRGYHTEEHIIISFYNAGDRIRFCGKYGTFWGSLWRLGAEIFLVSPVTGHVMALWGLAVTVLCAVEEAIAFGSSSALGAKTAIRT